MVGQIDGVQAEMAATNRRGVWRCRYQTAVAASAKDLARQVAGRLSAPNWERRFQAPTVIWPVPCHQSPVTSPQPRWHQELNICAKHARILIVRY